MTTSGINSLTGGPVTAVPQPTLGPNGYIAPAESAILTGVQSDINTSFNSDLNFGSTTNPTPQGQLATTQAAEIGNVNDILLWYTNNIDPAYASGRMQDAIGRIYFIERLPALPTIVQALCSGLAGTVIPTGALATDTSGNQYVCTQGGTIPATGSITLSFSCTVPGPTACPADALNAIYRAVPGWDSIINPADGVIGQNTESRAAFELRRQQSVAKNSFGAIGSIIGAVSEVAGVIDYAGYDNGSNSPTVYGGVTIAKNSIYICVAGGTTSAVAQAIWSKKSGGCSYNGNTTATAYDSNPLYPQPIPYSVTWETPAPLAVYFNVVLLNNPNVPANAATLVQNAIVNAFAGGDGGPRARINSTILATRFIAPILALGSWAQVVSIQIGSNNTPAAALTGSISGTKLQVSSVQSGTLQLGEFISGTVGGTAGGTAGGSGILPGTEITAFAGGTGGTGAYTVNFSQTAPVQGLIAALANQNSVTVNLNQIPVIAPQQIAVSLQ
jgi:hypothetical protein